MTEIAIPAARPRPARPRRRWLALLWLALAVVAFIGWSRSFRTVDVLIHPTKTGDRACVTSEFGLLVLEWHLPQNGGPEAGEAQPTWVYMYTPLPRRWPARWQALGFDVYEAEYRHYLPLPPGKIYGVAIPYWFITAGLALLAAGVWTQYGRTRRNERRLAAGCCVQCGYDMRGSPVRCPECGCVASG